MKAILRSSPVAAALALGGALLGTWAPAAPAEQAANSGRGPVADRSVATNLPGVRAYLAPPAGFNPLAASDAELAAFGLPPRPGPDAPARIYDTWMQTVTSRAEAVVPTLVQTSIVNGAMLPAGQPGLVPRGNIVPATSKNWSGFAVVNASRPFKSEEIVTQLTVPVAQQAFGACTGTYDYGSAWDGIDGDSSTDVLQAGIEFDAGCKDGSKAVLYSAWHEWAPLAEVRIGNFPIAPGDVVRVTVWNNTPTEGNSIIENYTTNQEVKDSFAAPSGRFIYGNSVEWIVERPLLSTGLATLTNYTGDPFTFCYAYNTTGTKTYYYPGSVPAGTGYDITMDDNSGKAISYPELQGLYDVWFYNEGSSR